MNLEAAVGHEVLEVAKVRLGIAQQYVGVSKARVARSKQKARPFEDGSGNAIAVGQTLRDSSVAVRLDVGGVIIHDVVKAPLQLLRHTLANVSCTLVVPESVVLLKRDIEYRGGVARAGLVLDFDHVIVRIEIDAVCRPILLGKVGRIDPQNRGAG
jgi:hypothetical protein